MRIDDTGFKLRCSDECYYIFHRLKYNITANKEYPIFSVICNNGASYHEVQKVEIYNDKHIPIFVPLYLFSDYDRRYSVTLYYHLKKIFDEYEVRLLYKDCGYWPIYINLTYGKSYKVVSSSYNPDNNTIDLYGDNGTIVKNIDIKDLVIIYNIESKYHDIDNNIDRLMYKYIDKDIEENFKVLENKCKIILNQKRKDEEKMEINKESNFMKFGELLEKKTGCEVRIKMIETNHYHFQLNKKGISLGVLCINDGDVSFAPFNMIENAKNDDFIDSAYMPMMNDFSNLCNVFYEMFTTDIELNKIPKKFEKTYE